MKQLQEAFDEDLKEIYAKGQAQGFGAIKKDEDSVMGEIRASAHNIQSAIKQEDEGDIRKLPDTLGDFMQNIN